MEFDPTDQEYKLKEAQSDLAENKLKVAQAEAQAEADTEEAKYVLQKAESDIRVAEFDVRKNPILPAITAKQNDLASAGVARIGRAVANGSGQSRRHQQGRHCGAESGGRRRRRLKWLRREEYRRFGGEGEACWLRGHPPESIRQLLFRRNDASRLPGGRYRSRRDGRGGNSRSEELGSGRHVRRVGSRTPIVGPARIDRSDRVSGPRSSRARSPTWAAPAGPPWNRHFECKIHLDNPTPDLRPGMSVRIVVTTDLRKVLWLPAQAVFESGSRTFVYVPERQRLRHRAM